MKYFKRLNLYKDYSGNNQYNPETETATSYGWWTYYKFIGNTPVFNCYSYSVTTSRHQRALRDLLRIDSRDAVLWIEAPQGLQDLNSSITYYTGLIEQLNDKIDRPRSHNKKNIERRQEIEEYELKINQVKELQKVDV